MASGTGGVRIKIENGSFILFHHTIKGKYQSVYMLYCGYELTSHLSRLQVTKYHQKHSQLFGIRNSFLYHKVLIMERNIIQARSIVFLSGKGECTDLPKILLSQKYLLDSSIFKIPIRWDWGGVMRRTIFKSTSICRDFR